MPAAEARAWVSPPGKARLWTSRSGIARGAQRRQAPISGPVSGVWVTFERFSALAFCSGISKLWMLKVHKTGRSPMRVFALQCGVYRLAGAAGRQVSAAAAARFELLRAKGFAVSASTVGRILGHLVSCGPIQPVPLLRRAEAKLSGAVERTNSSWWYEFYAIYTLPDTLTELNPLIDSCQHRYNHFRPHGALHGLTPAQYLATHHGPEFPPPRMS